jgi:zinc-ribbon domain
MAEPIAGKEKCANCGAEIRPDTQFCYGCGRAVARPGPPAKAEPPADSLRDLEVALAASRVDDGSKSKVETASAERRKARVAQRKPLEIVWEATGPGLVYFIVAAVIFLFVVAVVLLSRSVR